MQTKQLEREVARVTGETIGEIRRRGFSLADPINTDFDPEPHFLDWDELQRTELPRRYHRKPR